MEFEPEDEVRVLPLCRHYYHPDCVGEWLKRNKARAVGPAPWGSDGGGVGGRAGWAVVASWQRPRARPTAACLHMW